ncbi:hypothetical protein AQUCO_00700055v1 [Aquilegia coerulea]|uniref:Uncharacterized protein n=1 Tax=Aquilegia coerulea TaxID=218851 RepID=A0A2G5EIC5_AQUCA|nr:hypothetical protein AQUCO_00700055v1 [Aquilegia coerulea]
MNWFRRDYRRGPEWKQGWTSQTLTSISLPPFPLLVVFAIVILFLSLSGYTDYKENMANNMINFRLLLFLIPVALIFIVRNLSKNGSLGIRLPRSVHHSINQDGNGSVPWRVALLLLVLMLMIFYKSSF